MITHAAGVYTADRGGYTFRTVLKVQSSTLSSFQNVKRKMFHRAYQSKRNKTKTILACLARLHGVLLLCKWLANDQPLSSRQAVWAQYELMHYNMTIITPLSEPAMLQDFVYVFPMLTLITSTLLLTQTLNLCLHSQTFWV